MSKYIALIGNNKGMQLLVIFIVLDCIFGVLRALRERGINSTIGIDGIIRKVGMLISIVACIIIDIMVNIDLIGFLPSELKEYLHIGKCGINVIFTTLYCVFEILSILKNMIKCKLPIPKKIQGFLEKILKEFTSEIKEK